MYSKLEPIKKVARMIREHFDGVVGWVGWQISNGRLEGMNNRIRLVSHRSFGKVAPGLGGGVPNVLLAYRW